MAEAWIRLPEIPEALIDAIAERLLARQQRLADEGLCACPLCGSVMVGHAGRPVRPKIADIIRVVSQECGVAVVEIMSQRRARETVAARHIAMFLAHELTEATFVGIGRAFGRDHSTVANALTQVRQRLDCDIAFAAVVTRLRLRLAPVAEAAR